VVICTCVAGQQYAQAVEARRLNPDQHQDDVVENCVPPMRSV
jgi:hypothetical protein